MARKKEFDDLTAVRAARDVFWEHGYASTSLAMLQAATGLNKSSLYETYGSKRGIFQRAIQSYLSEVIDPLLGPLEADGAGKPELSTYFRNLAQHLRNPSLRTATRGCLLLNTAMELNNLDEAAADTVRAYRLRVQTAFRSALSSNADPERDAALLTTSQIGLMVTSRLDPKTAATIAETLAAEYDSP